MKIPGDEMSGVEFPGVEQKLLSPSDEADEIDRLRRGTASDAIGRLVGNGNRQPTVLGLMRGEDGASSSSRSVVIRGMLRELGGTVDDEVETSM